MAESGSNYFKILPRGYSFSPTDFELVDGFLRNKLLNPSVSYEEIYEVDIYKYHPQDLTARFNLNRANEWYFFSPRRKKYGKGNRPDRSAGGGFWLASGGDKIISTYRNGSVVGTRKTLVYHEGNTSRSRSKKTDWIMREYVLASKLPRPSMDDEKILDHCVLCKIYKKRVPPKNMEKSPTDPAQTLEVGQNSNGDHNQNSNSTLKLPQLIDPKTKFQDQQLQVSGDDEAVADLKDLLELASDQDEDLQS